MNHRFGPFISVPGLLRPIGGLVVCWNGPAIGPVLVVEVRNERIQTRGDNWKSTWSCDLLRVGLNDLDNNNFFYHSSLQQITHSCGSLIHHLDYDHNAHATATRTMGTRDDDYLDNRRDPDEDRQWWVDGPDAKTFRSPSPSSKLHRSFISPPKWLVVSLASIDLHVPFRRSKHSVKRLEPWNIN